MNQTVVVLDFGGQYKELIARRVREDGVYSLVLPGATPAAVLRERAPIGIILTGGPRSVYEEGAPAADPEIFALGIPVLGICYGQQLMCHTLGGKVGPAGVKEYGLTPFRADPSARLFRGIGSEQTGLMSHTDSVISLPDGFTVTATTDECPAAAVADEARGLYGTQFHPEVETTTCGKALIHNFLYDICGAKGDYSIDDFLTRQIAEIRSKVGDGRVLLALSGGVDSSVAAALLSQAIPGKLVCIFVDHGLMRQNEGDEVEAAFAHRELHFIRVNAADRFLTALRGVTDPEQKRKIIGREFIAVFNDEAAKLGNIPYLAQGTIYPDLIESGAGGGATIKSHHNVGGLPKDIGFAGIVEPLSTLFKDEVRALGHRLGLPRALTERQPFPGPGLGIRVIGEVTAEKLSILRRADAIFREEVGKMRRRPKQYFAVLTNMCTVGVMGDDRTYEYAVALRAVDTGDFMTATYVPLSHTLLSRVSTRIVAEVPGVNRVLYDITGKPPATIEYE